jgi:hypothetical protein
MEISRKTGSFWQGVTTSDQDGLELQIINNYKYPKALAGSSLINW